MLENIIIGSYLFNLQNLIKKVQTELDQHAKACAEKDSIYRKRASTLMQRLFTLTPEMYQAANVQSPVQSRYSNIPAISGPYSNYNANQIILGICIGEGPENEEAFVRMLSIVFDKKNSIRQFITLGAPEEEGRKKYYPYFTSEKGYRYVQDKNIDYTWKCISENNSDSEQVNSYTLKIIKRKYKEGCDFIRQKELITVYNIPTWQDHQSFNIAEKTRVCLSNLFNDCDQNPIFIHCSAGVGRSGTLVFPFYCQQSWQEILAPLNIQQSSSSNSSVDNAHLEEIVAKNLADKLIAMRQCRPGLIQTYKQLSQAIEDAMLLLQQRYQENFQLDEQAASSSSYHATMSQLSSSAEFTAANPLKNLTLRGSESPKRKCSIGSLEPSKVKRRLHFSDGQYCAREVENEFSAVAASSVLTKSLS